MNLMEMIIVMFLHCVSDLALLCRLSTNDLLKKVLGDPLQEGFSASVSIPLQHDIIATCLRFCRLIDDRAWPSGKAVDFGSYNESRVIFFISAIIPSVDNETIIMHIHIPFYNGGFPSIIYSVMCNA